MFLSKNAHSATLECSLDLQVSTSTIEIGPIAWAWNGRRFPYPERFKDRTVYYWSDADGAFQPAARFSSSLVKLVPTEWGAPTFEIDGIKMLPSAKVSPFEDARTKVALIQPKDKIILDTCGGLGYFGAWCVRGGAKHVRSYEINSGVLWLRSINPWSPASAPPLTLIEEDVTRAIVSLAAGSIDAVLHDPPRFGIAGELYSLSFYGQTRTRPQAPRTPLSLHGHPQQIDHRPGRSERGGEKIANRRIRNGKNRRWNTCGEKIIRAAKIFRWLREGRPSGRPSYQDPRIAHVRRTRPITR